MSAFSAHYGAARKATSLVAFTVALSGNREIGVFRRQHRAKLRTSGHGRLALHRHTGTPGLGALSGVRDSERRGLEEIAAIGR